MHRNKMKSESQKHAEKKVNKTKKNDGIHENYAFCFAMFRMCSFYFSHFFFRVIVVIGFSCFSHSVQFARLQCFFSYVCFMSIFPLIIFIYFALFSHFFRFVCAFLVCCCLFDYFFSNVVLCAFGFTFFSFALSVLFFPRFLKHILLELRIRATWRT